MAVKDDGTVIGWGDNADQTVPVPADVRTGVTAVAAGETVGFALKVVRGGLTPPRFRLQLSRV